MNDVIVTYETFHGSAKKIAEVISGKLNCKCINVDTPFEAENLSDISTLILVFNFRGPYTAQLTKLYLNRVKEQLKTKNVILVGEGLFSEKEFPIVADEIYRNNPSKTFNKFFDLILNLILLSPFLATAPISYYNINILSTPF